MKVEISEACAAGEFVCWMEAHPGLAAWVQLLSVVIAMAISVLAIWYPARLREIERLEAESQHLIAALHYVRHVRAVLVEVRNAVRDQLTQEEADLRGPRLFVNSAWLSPQIIPFTMFGHRHIGRSMTKASGYVHIARVALEAIPEGAAGSMLQGMIEEFDNSLIAMDTECEIVLLAVRNLAKRQGHQLHEVD